MFSVSNLSPLPSRKCYRDLETRRANLGHRGRPQPDRKEPSFSVLWGMGRCMCGQLGCCWVSMSRTRPDLGTRWSKGPSTASSTGLRTACSGGQPHVSSQLQLKTADLGGEGRGPLQAWKKRRRELLLLAWREFPGAVQTGGSWTA